MSKQAAAALALGIAGAAITCLFAYMMLQTNRDIWGWSSLIMGASTVWGLVSCINSETKSKAVSAPAAEKKSAD